MLQDNLKPRQISKFKDRILELVAKSPTPRTRISQISTEHRPIVHLALDELLDEGRISEHIILPPRGKPGRIYTLPHQTISSANDNQNPIIAISERIYNFIEHNPGTTRKLLTPLLYSPQPIISWILRTLIQQNLITEEIHFDTQNGIVKTYNIVNH